MPDPHPKTPLVPAILEWRDGERYVYKDDDGQPVMVPAYDPILEDFVIKHDHGASDNAVVGGLIQVYSIDDKTWNAVDMVTKIKDELRAVNNEWYEERDDYKAAATKCYNDHGNPDLTLGCRDYMNDDRRIGPASYDDGDGHKITVPPKFRQYLCYLCPFQQAYVNVELRRKKGYYK